MNGYSVAGLAAMKAVSGSNAPLFLGRQDTDEWYRYIAGDTITTGNDEWIIRLNDNSGNYYPMGPIRTTTVPTGAVTRAVTVDHLNGSGEVDAIYKNAGAGSTAWTQFTLGSGGGNSSTLIGETTLSSNQSSISFTSIPNTYDDLFLEIWAIGSETGVSARIGLQFNGDTAATSYAYGTMFVTQSTFTSRRDGQHSSADMGMTSRSGFGPIYNRITIFDYADNTITSHKFLESYYMGEFATTSFEGARGHGLWRNPSNAAVSSILISPHTNSFGSGTVAKLFGISN